MGREPTAHLVTQAGHAMASTLGQVLASATSNAVPTLTLENTDTRANTKAETSRRSAPRGRRRRRGSRHRPTKEGRPYYTFYRFYGHDTSTCWDSPRSSQRGIPRTMKGGQDREYPWQSASSDSSMRRQMEHMSQQRNETEGRAQEGLDREGIKQVFSKANWFERFTL